MYYAVGVYLGLCYIKYDGVCARRTDPLPQIFLEVKNNWAKGHFYTLPAALSLSLWMMTKLEPAASVCHHLPTSNHDREKKSLRLPTTKYIPAYFHTHVNKSKPRFQS